MLLDGCEGRRERCKSGPPTSSRHVARGRARARARPRGGMDRRAASIWTALFIPYHILLTEYNETDIQLIRHHTQP